MGRLNLIPIIEAKQRLRLRDLKCESAEVLLKFVCSTYSLSWSYFCLGFYFQYFRVPFFRWTLMISRDINSIDNWAWFVPDLQFTSVSLVLQGNEHHTFLRNLSNIALFNPAWTKRWNTEEINFEKASSQKRLNFGRSANWFRMCQQMRKPPCQSLLLISLAASAPLMSHSESVVSEKRESTVGTPKLSDYSAGGGRSATEKL